MGFQGRPLNEQVMVITGASSGIGLATARRAASKGARIVAAAREESALQALVEEIRGSGGQAIAVPTDVADAAAVDRLAEAAIGAFGQIDTWVNNAGVSIYGRVIDQPLEDKRRLFDTNFWGVVHGCRSAITQMRSRGGTIINVGSMVSDRAAPLQGAYNASKHAVKGYTDTLRMELEHDGIPIAVTLVKPAAIDTPFFEHARNYMTEEPTPPPPVYAAETVARAICRCAERPVRDINVGGSGRFISVMGMLAPRTTDAYMKATMFSQQKSHRLNDHRDGLEQASGEGRVSGDYEGHVMHSSAYTRAMLSDLGRVLPFVAAGAAIAAIAAARRH